MYRLRANWFGEAGAGARLSQGAGGGAGAIRVQEQAEDDGVFQIVRE
jgi:hypothetical protein